MKKIEPIIEHENKYVSKKNKEKIITNSIKSKNKKGIIL